jgi:hypothetical protein
MDALRNIRILAGTRIRAEGDLSLECTKLRRGLIPYQKDAKRRGHRACLKKDSVVVEGKTYDLETFERNIQIGARSDELDTPT